MTDTDIPDSFFMVLSMIWGVVALLVIMIFSAVIKASKRTYKFMRYTLDKRRCKKILGDSIS